MSISDFTKRLKLMLKEEYEVSRMEVKILHKDISLFKKIAYINDYTKTLKASVEQSSRKIAIIHEKLELLRKLITEETMLSNVDNDILFKQNECSKSDGIHGERHRILMTLALSRFFKDASKTYTNSKSDCHGIQGVNISNNKWKLVETIACNYSPLHLAQWRSLIFKDKSHDKNNDESISES